jgi:hypothetical protein
VASKGWILVLPCFGTNCNRHAWSDHLQFENDPELVLVTLHDSFHTRYRTPNAVTNAIAAEALRLMLAVRAENLCLTLMRLRRCRLNLPASLEDAMAKAMAPSD